MACRETRSADHRGLAFAVWGMLQIALAEWTCNAQAVRLENPVRSRFECYETRRLRFHGTELQ